MDKIPQLDPARMTAGEYARTIWVVTVEQGITIPVMEDPSFWAHVAEKLRPWDRIEVRADDGTFFAEFIVIAAERAHARVHKLLYIPLMLPDGTDEEFDSGYQLKWRGPFHLWSVIRKSDHSVIKDGMQKDEAKVWLDEYLKKVA